MTIELNITKFVDAYGYEGMPDDDGLMDFSGSQMEHGSNAGRITWDKCIEFVTDGGCNGWMPLKHRDEYRDYIYDFGAWGRGEINGWSPVELRALILQLIAGDLREVAGCDSYEDYQEQAESGSCSGRAYRGDDGDWYYCIGN